MKKVSGILALFMFLAGLAGCQESTAEVPELLEPVGVKTDSAVVQYGDVYDISVYGGEIAPYLEELCFEVDGRLGEVLVSVGDTVEAGQLLVTLDSEDLLEKIEALEEDVAYAAKANAAADRKAEIKVEIAKLELKGLEEEIEVEPKTIKTKKLEIEQLEAARIQDRELRQLSYDKQIKELSELREDLESMDIYAPFAGTVVYITQEKSDTSISSDTIVVTIADENQLFIVSEYIPDYTMQGADRIYAKVLDQEYAVTHVPMEMEEYLERMLASKEMYTRFSVENTDGTLSSGQYAAITVIDNFKDNVLVIPINALFRDAMGHYVYKLIDGERVRQDISVGTTTGIEAVVTEGLQEGDVVYVKE